jgi:D-tyrosyl-tRNA(Tyr) deacylase
MRVVIQRVSQALVTVDGAIVGQIERGLLALVGVGPDDTEATATLLAEKVAHLRIFPDDQGRFNRSLRDVNGAILVVSQFTLYADTRRGRRPSFADAAPPEVAALLVGVFADALRAYCVRVANGVFGAHMLVALVNDGPVTIVIDTDTFREPRRT